MPGEDDLMAGNGGFRITNRELYDLLLSVRDRVITVEHEVKLVSLENLELQKQIKEERETVKEEMKSLKNRYYVVLAGLVSALGVLVAQGVILR